MDSDKKTANTCKGTSLMTQIERMSAITAIYEKYNVGLLKYLNKRLQSKEDVEDVAQEVYIRLIKYTNLDGLEPSLPLLCTIAANLIKDRLRKAKTKAIYRHVSLSDIETKSNDTSPEEIAMSREGVEKFKHVFRSLKKDCRKVFILHRLEGFTYEEISVKMGISKSMVYKHLNRAMLHIISKF